MHILNLSKVFHEFNFIFLELNISSINNCFIFRNINICPFDYSLQSPFVGGNRQKIQQKIIKDKIKLPAFLSSEAHSLLKGVIYFSHICNYILTINDVSVNNVDFLKCIYLLIICNSASYVQVDMERGINLERFTCNRDLRRMHRRKEIDLDEWSSMTLISWL